MNVLELFAGSRSVGKAAESLGMNVFSSDLNAFDGIDYAVDILDFDVNKVPFIPDVIWASPPCTTYSIAAVFCHRDGQKPKTPFAEKSDRMIAKLHDIIDHFTSINPDLKYFIENPRGMLRKMDFMRRHLDRRCVMYCRYGDTRMKPTDIWSNHIYSLFNPNGWIPREQCFNGNKNCHHEEAPRGSKTSGTQGLKDNYQRSKIPNELCLEILQSTIRYA